MNEREYTYEEGINLEDVLFYCIKKWRWIVSIMLFMGFLLGGYKFFIARQGNQTTLQQWETMGIEEKEKADTSDVLYYYQSAIKEGTEALRLQEEYLENSVVMQLDANHLQRGVLSYLLHKDDIENISMQTTLIAAFKAFVTDGRLAQALYAKDEDIALADLQFLITFFDSDSADMSIRDTSEMKSNLQQDRSDVFQVQIVTSDADSCEKYLALAAQQIQEYSKELENLIGNHELVLLGSTVSENQVQDIRNYQREILDNYKTAARDLNTLRTEAKTYADNLEVVDDDQNILSEPILLSPIKLGVKYGILGLVVGAFIAGSVLVVRFFVSDKLRSTANFENKFGIRILGRVITPVNGKRIFGFLDRWILRMGEGAYASLPYEEQLRITTVNVKAAIPQKAGNIRIMIAGSIASRDTVEICREIAQVNKDTIFSDYRQLAFDAFALEELSACDGVLFIEKRDVSSTRLILQERKLALDRGVTILGMVIL